MKELKARIAFAIWLIISLYACTALAGVLLFKHYSFITIPLYLLLTIPNAIYLTAITETLFQDVRKYRLMKGSQ
jgi:hypothetical protein